LGRLENRVKIIHYTKALSELTGKKYNAKFYETECDVIDEFKLYCSSMKLLSLVKQEKTKIKLAINSFNKSVSGSMIATFLTIIIAFVPIIFTILNEYSSQATIGSMSSMYSLREELIKVDTEIKTNEYKLNKNILLKNETVEEIEKINEIMTEKSRLLQNKINAGVNLTSKSGEEMMNIITNGVFYAIIALSIFIIIVYAVNQYFSFESAHKKAFYSICYDILEELEVDAVSFDEVASELLEYNQRVNVENINEFKSEFRNGITNELVNNIVSKLHRSNKNELLLLETILNDKIVNTKDLKLNDEISYFQSLLLTFGSVCLAFSISNINSKGLILFFVAASSLVLSFLFALFLKWNNNRVKFLVRYYNFYLVILNKFKDKLI